MAPFLEHVHQEKPRYYRDQLGVIRKLFEDWNTALLTKGLHYCSEKELYSAGDIKSSIIYLAHLETEPKKKKNLTALPSKYRGNMPEIRNLSVYEQAMLHFFQAFQEVSYITVRKKQKKKQLNQLSELAWIDGLYNLILS